MVEIAESKRLPQLYEKQNSQSLRALRAAAFIRSIGCSNRLAGIIIAPERLPVLVAGRAKPLNRSEEVIRGYAQALKLVHAETSTLEVTTDFVRGLHEVVLSGAAEAGERKLGKNELPDVRRVEPQSLTQRAISVTESGDIVEELCALYREELQGREVHSLLAVAALMLDFLCIRPFREGNGRISRLLVLASLYRQGYEVGRYVSLERLFEASREQYVEALRRSSEGWHEGKHDPIPWLNYFFSILQRAYLEFERRATEPRSNRFKKIPLVEAAIDSLPYEFTLSELERTCPGASRETISRAVRQLRKNGALLCIRRGSAVRWQKAGDLILGVQRS